MSVAPYLLCNTKSAVPARSLYFDEAWGVVCIKSPPLISYQYFRRKMLNKKQMQRLLRHGAPKFEEVSCCRRAKANQEPIRIEALRVEIGVI